MRTKILITNISDFNVRLIDVNHYNKAVSILFVYCSSYINLEQQKKNILIHFFFFIRDFFIRDMRLRFSENLRTK